MKYVFYIDSMQMGGAQRVMNNLIDYFVMCDIEIVLINDIAPSDNEPEYKINDKVKRLFLNNYTGNVFAKNIKRILDLRAIVKTEKPDLVLSFLGPPNVRMLISTLGVKTKKIVSVRNDPYKEYGYGIKAYFSKCIFLLADGCVFQTEDAQNYFFNSTRKKSTIILNPVNEKFFNHCWKADGRDIVLIGRLQAQKIPLLALEAFIMIANRFSDFNMVFYGDEELSSSILKKAKDNNLDNRVRIAGKTQYVETVLENAALYILSSDYEGMPNALMEAMTVGVPVISTDCPCGGPRMLIKEVNQGVLVPCGDVKALAEAMTKVLSNQELQTEMSTHEQKRSSEFHPTKIYRQWEEYLK